MSGPEVIAHRGATAEAPEHPLAASGLPPHSRHAGVAFGPSGRAAAVDDRPPMATVAEYLARSAGMAG